MQGLPGPRGLLSSQFAGNWNCCILLYIAMQAYKKCSVCLGPSKVMGKIFCHMCMKHTSQVTLGVQARGHFDALWCNLHLYLNLFCVNIIFFNFLVLNIFCGVNFFLGPAVSWSCGFCRPVAMREIDSHITMLQESLCQWFLSKVRPCHRGPCLAHVPMIKLTISSAIMMNNFI